METPYGLNSYMAWQDAVCKVTPPLGVVFQNLAAQKEIVVLERHLMVDHTHRLIAIPPKYGMSQGVGCCAV